MKALILLNSQYQDSLIYLSSTTYKKEIAEWLKGGATKPFENKLELGTDLGNIVGRGKFGTKTGTKVSAVLAKDETKQGWHIVTSFPVL